MSERLGRNALPRHYRLEFEPDLESGRVRVREAIDLVLERPARKVELHGVGLEIGRVAARTGARSVEGSARPGRGGQSLVFEFPRRLDAGEIRLDLDFHAKLRPSLNGLYVATRGEDRFLASQFESTDARAAFVCFDEPDSKATFDLTLVVPEGWVAVSNGPIVSSAKLGRGLVRHRFSRTRPIPTYLVALCAGPWEVSEVRAVRGVPVRVLAPRGRGGLARTALDFACAAQAALEDYFAIPYPFEKCDHVAVPDFAAGAMENAGCITYRETLLLVDPATISIPQLRDMAGVITHELAHQWFGNLVTPRWWSDLWLNESFATWIEERILDGLHPEWEVWTEAEVPKSEALGLDALVSTHPVRNESEKVEEIEQSFDAITYLKGAAVVRMIENWLGPGVMQAGIRTYLARHADSTATAEDLWRALEEASGKPVSRTLAPWITRPGFPLVRLGRRGGRVRLAQERFFADPSRKGRARERWPVPIILGGPGVEESLVLEGPQADLRVPAGAGWLCGNGGAGGFYRVEYDSKARSAVVGAFGVLAPTERAGLVDDLWALARKGRPGLEDLLSILDGFGAEKNHVVLGRGLARLKTLADGIAPEGEANQALRRRVGRIFGPHLDDLGWDRREGEPEADRLRRALAIEAVGDLAREEAARARAAEMVERYLAEPRTLDPDLLTAVLRIAARRGDESLFRRLDEMRRQAPTPQLERTYLLARCEFEDAALVAGLLEEALTEAIRSQDIASVFSRLLSNPKARWQAWGFVQERFDALNARAIPHMWRRIVESLPALGTAEALRQARAHFERHPLPDTTEAIAQTLEAMRLDLAFRRRARPRVARWLERTSAPA